MAPTSHPAYVKETPEGLLLALKVQPRASTNEVVGELGPELRVRLTAPPVDSAANVALLQFLADTFDRPRGQLTLVRGQTSRHKVVLVRGLTVAEALPSLSAAIRKA